jgi:hypothetical protein
VVLGEPIVSMMAVWWEQNWKVEKIVEVDRTSVRRNWVRHGNTAQDRRIRDLAIGIGKAAALLSELLRNLSVLVYDMSVQQPFAAKIKDSNFSLSKRYISYTSPLSEVIFLSEFTGATPPLL